VELTRSCKVRLQLGLKEATHFVQSYTDACNYASRIAFTLPRPENAKNLHKATYSAVRAFGLSAQIACSAVRAVAAKYKALKKLGRPAEKPVVFSGEPVQLQGGERARDFGFREGAVSLSTLSGRVKVRYQGPPVLEEYRKHWKLGGALLQVKDGKVYLLVSFSREFPDTKLEGEVVGGDRGLKNQAVVSNGKESHFFGGGHVQNRKAHFRRVRASVQSRKAHKKTRSIRRFWARLRGREARFMKNVNHILSRRILEFVLSLGAAVIALEDLSGIRERGMRGKKFRIQVHTWAYYQLQEYIEYKAAGLGIVVVYVDPAYTSQGCSRCGYTDRKNRYGLQFHCKACGLRLHADLNGARNVRLRGVQKQQALLSAGPSSVGPKVPGSSGTSCRL
jgi:putative transposase